MDLKFGVYNQVSEKRVQGVGCRVQGVGCRVQGVGCRVFFTGVEYLGLSEGAKQQRLCITILS